MQGIKCKRSEFLVKKLFCKKFPETLHFGWIYDIMVVSGKQKVFSGYFCETMWMERIQDGK